MQRSTEALPDTAWFALLDAGLVAAAGAVWYNWPELGLLPLLAALLPWGIRLFWGRFPVKRTPLDIPILLFLATALIGIWAAYDQDRALAKFWMILDGVLLFYALAGQPRANRWLIAWALGGFAVALSFYFFLTHDWTAHPAKIAFLNRLGLTWMGVRPTLSSRILHPNIVAGVSILTAPFLVAVGLREWHKGRRVIAFLPAAGLLFVFFALLMTTSRGAWLSLATALGLWLLWAFSGFIARQRDQTQFSVFLTLLAVLLVIGVVGVLAYPGGLVGVVNQLPGPSHTGSRLDLIQALSLLIGDFPFTGGGLDAFAGLYAHYVLVNPSYNLEHGHDMFLDMTLEQGLIGGLAAITIILVTGWLLLQGIRKRQGSDSMTSLLLWASLAGMIAMSLHGVMDDALYGSRAQLLLWVAPGFGMSVLAGQKRTKEEKAALPPERRATWFMVGASLLVLLIYLWLFRVPLQVTWQANLAAVRMSQLELADFPTDTWDDGRDADQLLPVAADFESVLQMDPGNRTAHHRLGLIAMLFRDYDTAVNHLEVANQVTPGHPGIVKSLAYSYIWAGRIDDALPLLKSIPEAVYEMGVYVQWWRNLGREDLSQNASAIIRRLNSP